LTRTFRRKFPDPPFFAATLIKRYEPNSPRWAKLITKLDHKKHRGQKGESWRSKKLPVWFAVFVKRAKMSASKRQNQRPQKQKLKTQRNHSTCQLEWKVKGMGFGGVGKLFGE